jgi:hypothetical protein
MFMDKGLAFICLELLFKDSIEILLLFFEEKLVFWQGWSKDICNILCTSLC